MDLNEAKIAVDQILDEESQRPTIFYELRGKDFKERLRELVLSMENARELRNRSMGQHGSPVREVSETPEIHELRSTNYKLLMSVYSQIPENNRFELIAHILRRVEKGGPRYNPCPPSYIFPQFLETVCELPLVAEFSIRTGNAEHFFQATTKTDIPTIPLAIMMLHLETTLTLQWNMFSSEQLAQVSERLEPLRKMAEQQMEPSRVQSGKVVHNERYQRGRERQSRQIVDSIDHIAQYCERARYFYLKGALQQKTIIEVENDKFKVEEFLSNLGFSDSLMLALNEAEKDYRDSASPFELKNCLIHFRGFMEHLHLEAAQYIAKIMPGSVHDWDTSTAFLRKNGYITIQQEKFARGIHALISDEWVHPLMSERIFARVLRNVIIEYGFMFLTIMNEKGVVLS